MADFFARKKVSKDVELEQLSHELDPMDGWAINTKSLNEAANKKVVNLDKNATGGSDKAGAYFRQFFMANPPNVFVSTENPYRLNERLAVQRGVFLCPGDVTKSFQDNLTATGTVEAYQIEIAAAYRGQLGQMLHRLNIDKEVLFPGLQGLAEALRDRLPHLDKFVSDDRADASWIGRAMDDPKDGHHA